MGSSVLDSGGTIHKACNQLVVNGEAHEIEVESRRLLVEVLREDLGLTGTKRGCDSSACGACTVLLDGLNVHACSLLAVQANGRRVTTIEGIGNRGQLHPVQQAFLENQGYQCGYCTPGMVMSAVRCWTRTQIHI